MSKTSTQKRRLRKKLYLGEFAILGFEFSCKVKEASEEEYSAFFDSLVEIVGSRNLFVNLGSCIGVFNGLVSSGDRYGSATQEDLDAVKAGLEALALTESVEMTELSDVFYG